MDDTPPSYVVEHSTAFLKLCRLRIEQLNVSLETVDEICGFPLRYASRLMAEERGLTAFTMFTLARGLALLPVFQHDEKQLQLLQRHSAWRPLHYVRKQRAKHVFAKSISSPEYMAKLGFRGGIMRAKKLTRSRRVAIARMGASARLKKLTPEQRRDSARKAIKARWSRVRSVSSPAS
jgi:hypothetical protein